MVKALNDDDDPALVADHCPVGEPDAAVSDDALLGLLDAMAEDGDGCSPPKCWG